MSKFGDYNDIFIPLKNMTDKQQRILEVALQLFAKEGYNSVTTAKIAKEACVSEGLIFKHFKNKEGLLDTIKQLLKEKLDKIGEELVLIKDPKGILKRAIEIIFEIDKNDYDCWRLQYQLKMDPNFNAFENKKPFIDLLTGVFTKLEYEDPSQEAFLFYYINDTTFLQLLEGNISDKESYKQFLFKKYDLI
ncbi:TetR/AcrR family transcriptional regulator [Tenacibaculum xiamenense]|uniref:TetR/AcrR family transcriptional regulator n=1 Tax=Tenacibaculum xiamenense TaxID=1261553 RepID=UPI0038B62567